ncbi:translation elongation factor 4 [Acetohalobium arabaticum]|uniref:Elongation factor 4 n=1 Tax=Acetohalobium arabaticum (strain ATCC 49924 / DSM 5501 / Z-7288) TaxID=574087 RepID=D9QV83_ACEAZ|nr:translation elongation factor 4 [Acetohalobium arabaticum]ADL12142.1 GTP-binding protein LepA [Acetohalobium arabaticum DSM 5501]
MSGVNQDRIINFCIIAHVDHGKSTLADRLLEYTDTIEERDMEEQLLDTMELERERGITIKAQAVRMNYEADDGQNYILNLIDTPGHVDFNYEVSRSLEACEGALLVIDAAQGVEAQTLANIYLALEADLEIIPVINKIDLDSARPDLVKEELIDIGIDPDEAILTSAKEGVGIGEVLDAVVERVSSPAGDIDRPLKALIFDSVYDPYQGVIAYYRVVEGSIEPGMEIEMMATEKTFEVEEVGIFTPNMESVDRLVAGEVGYVIAGIKDVKHSRVGDTITEANNPTDEPLPGYQKAKPMVYCGLYPVEGADYDLLRDALEKLQLNDAALTFEPETSEALGFGYRGGFLGLLHMEIIQERLEREYDLDLITTAPSVVYKVHKEDGEVLEIENPAKMPEPQEIDFIEEPFVEATIMLPDDYVGDGMELAQDRRGEFEDMQYLDETRVKLVYELPLSEIILDFFDQLKSATRGYATLDYEFVGYREADLVKLNILVNKDPIDALSCIVHEDNAYEIGQSLTRKLKEFIPEQMFEVPVQAAIGNNVIARQTIRAKRKNVLQKCYGGDVSRKRKLLEKQKEGKKRMKQVGSVEIPQEAFMAILSIDE